MTDADRRRYHAWRAKLDLDHEEIKRALKLRGYIAESTSELDTQGVNLLIHHMRKGNVMGMPPCPDTEDARAVEEEKAAREAAAAPNKRPRTWDGHKGLFALWRHLADLRDKPPAIAHGKDDRLVALLRKTYTDRQIQTAMRRFWCLESMPSPGYKLQAWLEDSKRFRTIALFYTQIDGLLPEVYDQKQREARDRVHGRIKRLPRRAQRDHHTHAPSASADFDGLPAVR